MFAFFASTNWLGPWAKFKGQNSEDVSIELNTSPTNISSHIMESTSFDGFLTITTLFDTKLKIPLTPKLNAEDVCIEVCKKLGIGPIGRHLFALRTSAALDPYFLIPCHEFTEQDCLAPHEFRLRYKVPDTNKLRRMDAVAYDYYFQQARVDVIAGSIEEIDYKKHRAELIGLGIADMFRVMQEQKIQRQGIQDEYMKYIPRDVLRQHHKFFNFLIKIPIRRHLKMLSQSRDDVRHIKAQYLMQLDKIAPDYLSEIYHCEIQIEGEMVPSFIKISPHHPTEPGIKFALTSDREKWILVTSIEDTPFISIIPDENPENVQTIQLNRGNGSSVCIKFANLKKLQSFVSCVDGYYRFMCNFYFNICQAVQTPSLHRLAAMKCHGPVGGVFSYAKLEKKTPENNTGYFILRESELDYDTYFIDVYVKNSVEPKTFKLIHDADKQFIFNDDKRKFDCIQMLKKAYSDSEEEIFLNECLPVSENDSNISPLPLPMLLFASENATKKAVNSDETNLVPSCINAKHLRVYKGQEMQGMHGLTIVERGMWIDPSGKKQDVAIKKLKQDSGPYLQEFNNLLGQYAFVKSEEIVKLFGFTILAGKILPVLEYFPLGPLDKYLQTKKVKKIDLFSAARDLSLALGHLRVHKLVHGNIRCRKIMVYKHDEKNTLNIKLCDPGAYTEYSPYEIHWIPPECYNKLNNVRRSFAADVWALGTTLWEIFSLAAPVTTNVDHLDDKLFYLSGQHLSKPKLCCAEMYNIMKDCWNIDPDERKPNEISRGIQYLYDKTNNFHFYHKIDAVENTPAQGTAPLKVTHEPDLLVLSEKTKPESISLDNLTLMRKKCMSAVSVEDLPTEIESAYEDGEYKVVPTGVLGEGNFGKVIKAKLYKYDDESFEKEVAVKKMKSDSHQNSIDFEREISILKSLKHPNIVEYKTVVHISGELCLVMELVSNLSLKNYLKNQTLKKSELLLFAVEIAEGMAYLGEMNIVHRDLAARNILVTEDKHVKITDFGLAQALKSNPYYIANTKNRSLPIKWYAIECITQEKFSFKSDVWSYGVTMCEVFGKGEEPKMPCEKFCTTLVTEEFLKDLSDNKRYPKPKYCSKNVYDRIIFPCWNAVAQKRPDFHELAAYARNLKEEGKEDLEE